MRELVSIQYLRGLAAISVVFFHISEAFGGSFKLGAAGVDIFFVISGFIMWFTTAGKDVGPQKFMIRRIMRIVPVYWVVTTATAAALFLKPNFFPEQHLGINLFIGSVLFLPPVTDGKMQLVVIQGWTLVFEMFFYLVFAGALLARERWRPWLVAGTLGAFLLLQPALPSGLLQLLADPIILEFAAGMILARVWMCKVHATLWLGIAVLLGGVGLLPLLAGIAPHLPRVLGFGIPAVAIVTGSVFLERKITMPAISVLKVLGDASYSIYLWHVLVLVVMQGILFHITLNKPVQIAFVLTLTIPLTVPFTTHSNARWAFYFIPYVTRWCVRAKALFEVKCTFWL